MRGVALCSVLVSACTLYSEAGDDVPWPEDDAPQLDAPIDAGLIDAAVDAPIDCCELPQTQVTGRVLLYEVEHLDPASDGSLGQGLVADIGFVQPDDLPAPIVETQPGTVFGCKAWVFNRPQATLAAAGLDEGTVLLGLPGLKPPPVGMCVFMAGTGYRCPGATAITPDLADPGMLPDAVGFAAELIMGGGLDVPPFSGTGPDVGDDFTLPPASLALLENIPRNGSAFTIGCDPMVCDSGAVYTELEIVTTDAPTAGLGPFDLPLPIDRRIVIRCAELGSPTITVPGVVSHFLSVSMATRIQTTYRRGRFATATSTVIATAGHALSGMSN